MKVYCYVFYGPQCIWNTATQTMTEETILMCALCCSHNGQDKFTVCTLTHSLTHCCAWPAKGRSVLQIERSWPTIQAAPTDRPMSSSTCCSQFLRGRPGGHFQSAAGGVPVWASIDSCVGYCSVNVFTSYMQQHFIFFRIKMWWIILSKCSTYETIWKQT